MGNDELGEQLAAVQHEIWAHWMRYMFTCGQFGPDGSWHMPAFKAERWQRQMDTPYAELTDRERESDREQADKILAVVAPQLAAATVRADAAEALGELVAEIRNLNADLAAAIARAQEAQDLADDRLNYINDLTRQRNEESRQLAIMRQRVEAAEKALAEYITWIDSIPAWAMEQALTALARGERQEVQP